MTDVSSFRRSLALLAASFLLWGVLRSLNDLLVALFHASGTTHYATATLVHISFFSAYLLFSLPGGMYLRRFGYRSTLTAALSLMTLGSAVCIPAFDVRSVPLCLAGVFTMATGVTLLQTSANPCIGLLGAATSAASRLLLVQAFSSLGSILGPLTGIILFGSWSRQGRSFPLVFPRVQLTRIYLLLTVLSLALVVLIRFYFADNLVHMRTQKVASRRSLLRRRRLIFGVAAAFLYVGSEATLLNNAIPYLSMRSYGGFLPATGAALISVYWGFMLFGRIFAGTVLRGLATRTLLQNSCFMALLLSLVCIFRTDYWGALALLSIGLFNSVMFPSIFSLSLTGLREEELPHASALLSMAICGGAVMPLLGGALIDHFGTMYAFVPPALAYLLIGLFSNIFFSANYHVEKELLVHEEA